MARALSNGKIFLAALSDGIVLSSRGFSSAAGRGMLEEKAVMMKGMNNTGAATSDAAAAAVAWVPDPVTGNYRPANLLRETDPAEQRLMFLKKKA